MELNAEGETPAYMKLAQVRFRLGLCGGADEALRRELEEGIWAGGMAPYYRSTCAQFGWAPDEARLAPIEKEMAAKKAAFEREEGPEPAEWQERLEYLCSVGDRAAATALASAKCDDKQLTTNKRLEAVFALFRLAYFHGCDVREMGAAVRKAHSLVDRGGDWRSRNKLKAYEAVYCLSVREYARAADLFVDCVSTFESYELLDFGTVVQYCVLACMIALARHQLQLTLQKQGATVQALRCQFPRLREFVESLHECRYADFVSSLAWVETQICADPVFYPHYHYYVREMRVKAYVQLLRAYRSLSLANIADTFGLTGDYVEDDISRFTAAGRLQCRIDAVNGCVVTGAADGAAVVGGGPGSGTPGATDRSALYQGIIREGDLLLNRVKKLASVINF